MRDIARRGFEVGVHTYNHTRWQDNVADANGFWTREQLQLAQDQFMEIFERAPAVHGAAGWQINFAVPGSNRHWNSAMPRMCAAPSRSSPWSTASKCWCRSCRPRHLLALTAAEPHRDHVFTLHAELEGGVYLSSLERLLRSWRESGVSLGDLAGSVATLDIPRLPAAAL